MSRARWSLIALVACAACSHSSPAADTPSTAPPPVSSMPAAPSTPSTEARSPRSSAAPSSAAPSSTLPPLSATARAAGLIDVRSIVPDAIVDLRYRTANNFTHVRLYPRTARCLVHRSMVAGLKIAANRLRRQGGVLVFWDCYRPHAVQVRMFKIVPDPNWVARPGPYARSHEAGRSVDVTLARANTRATCSRSRTVQHHCLLAMGTGLDDFTPRAYAFATAGISAAAVANRARLRHAMAAGGLTVYAGEWWHFDGPGALVPRPHLHAPLR